ncbi:MAG: hypothetical protein R3C01_17100, partial [Planctomycetaceae bacterium]
LPPFFGFSSPMHRYRVPSVLCRIALPALMVGATGCQFWFPADPGTTNRTGSLLQPVKASQEAIDLELFFIERPVGDPLMDSGFWYELDQINTVSSDIRERLQSNGLRFGIAGSPTPPALLALLKEGAGGGPGMRTMKQQYRVPTGISHEFPCNPFPSPCVISLIEGNESQEREIEQGRGIIRCRVERAQNGWAKIELLPEIRHGDSRMRPTPGDNSWELSGGQESIPVYSNRFTIDLNESEMIVLGAVGSKVDSLGGRFFRTDQDGNTIERLLVLKFGGLSQVAGVTQPH